MQLVSAKDVFDEARQCLEGKTLDGKPYPKDLDKAEKLLNELLNNNVGSPQVLYVLAALHMCRANFGLAIQVLSQLTQANPQFGEAWNNLGLCFRGINDWDKAVFCMRQAGKYIDHPDIPCNLSGLHLNRNMAEKALEYANSGLAINPEHIKLQWHKAMALLEMHRFDEAWDLHESRLVGGANENIAPRNYHGSETTPWWDGKSKETVVIHGEQGMGDEIMFASCLPDAIATGAKIIFEPSPRLEKLFQRSFPETSVYGTDLVDGRKWIKTLGKPDSKCAIGSLPKFYRRTAESFPGTPYLVPDPQLKAWWGDKLRALGPKPKIGIAWQGGVSSTRVDARSFHPSLYAPLFKHEAHWVSLQYDKTAKACVEEVKRDLGIEIAHWPKAVEARDPETGKPSDLDELCALMSNLDMVISVCQTTIHFAGALGIPCLCLTPSQPSWRYGAVEGPGMPWYKSVRQIRQKKETSDWNPVIAEANAMLGRFLDKQERRAC